MAGGGLSAWLDTAAAPDDAFVDDAFRLVLRRDPDPGARERALAKLAEGSLSRATLLHELVTAAEFERVRLLDDAVAFAAGARARGERPRLLQGPRGTDERVIEVPWVLARLRAGSVLEVGYAFAEPAYLAALVAAAPGRLAGADLAAAEVPFETVQADVRDLPFGDRTFDQVLLVSTLEHVGADNTVYGLEVAEEGEGARRAALRELRRVLRPGGSLLVTVPLGEPADHGWFREDDVRGWTRLFARAGFFVEEQEAYELGVEGWRAAPAFRAEGVRYGERGPAASAVLCADCSPRRLRRLVAPDGIRRTARRRLGPAYRRARPRSQEG